MTHRGGCLCGGVRYAVLGALKDPNACHCSQCARTSGNFAAMSACAKDDLKLLAAETLSWFRSSDNVQRGFCKTCGGNLFWQCDSDAEVYVTAGSLDRPTGVKLAEHIFVGSISDFYKLHDDLPKKESW